jgi:hypothetical protein
MTIGYIKTEPLTLAQRLDVAGSNNLPLKCHLIEMELCEGDNGDGTSVVYWECKHCGHTIEFYRINHNGN